MNTKTRRIAVNVGSGFVPGMNAVVKGVTMAAAELGWEAIGIRNGFAGLLEPENFPTGGLLTLSPSLAELMDPGGSSLLGQASRVDPFHMSQMDEDGMVEVVDRSDELLAAFEEQGIDSLVSVVGGRGLSVLYKLQRKGLNVVCIPRSLENDIAATMVSLNFNSALTFTIEMLDRAREAAVSSRQIFVIEVHGQQAGWLALQAGTAAGADAILIPELPIDLDSVALSPHASGASTVHAIHGSGKAAETVANRLQLLLAEKVYPMVIGPWVRGGQPSAVDRQLSLAYGAGAIRALNAGQGGVMVSFQPPAITFVPLIEAINKIRTVPADNEMILTARSLGINLGGAQ